MLRKKLSKLFIVLIALFLFTSCQANKRSEINSLDDLKGKVIGVQLGTAEDLTASTIEDSTVEEYNSPYDCIQALLQDKVDAVIMNDKAAEAFLAINDSLLILEQPLADDESAICISKQNTELKAKINKVIADIKADGTLENIIDHYFNDSEYEYVSDTTLDRSNGVLKVATNAEFEPYEYIENGQYVGIDMDLCRVIADRLNMSLEIDDMQFSSIITSVVTGKNDIGVAGMTITEERLKNVDFTDVIYSTSKQVAVVHKGNSSSISSFGDKLYQNFIKDDRYKSLLQGLGVTLLITLFAEIIGLVLGLVIAFIRYTHDKLHILKIGNFIAKIYLAIIRGTPSVIQLLIIYYVIFASTSVNKIVIATIAFGINSGAYVSEIIRAGWNSIDSGQYEAGRAMGFSYFETMHLFILPQALKNVVPTLGNELIVLLKETAISGYIGIFDLTRAGDFIRSRTYEALLPLLSVALIYLIIVIIMSYFISLIERRLKKNEKH